MDFGPAYLRGYKAGLLDGEISCLERQLDRYEREAAETTAAIEVQQSRVVENQLSTYTLH